MLIAPILQTYVENLLCADTSEAWDFYVWNEFWERKWGPEKISYQVPQDLVEIIDFFFFKYG